MIDQKELINEIIKTYDYMESVYNLICSWLEDINWHSENRKIIENMPTQISKNIDDLEMMSFAKFPSDYSTDYIKSIENNNDFIMAKHKASIFSDKLYDFHKSTHDYNFISRLFGWGINTTGWKSNGSGDAFVKELQEMIREQEIRINKLQEEKEATRLAYERAYN